jgi:transaldolase
MGFTLLMTSLAQLPIQIFADGADLAGVREHAAQTWVSGLTTNPTLLRKAGVRDYKAFALEALALMGDRPVSLEVLAGDLFKMREEALDMARWGPQVFVKIPVVNGRGESSAALIADLVEQGVRLNVTAVLSSEQAETVARALSPEVPAMVSVFAGRVGDTGREPTAVVKQVISAVAELPHACVVWASVREVWNIYEAAACGCHAVTVPNDILRRAVACAGMSLTDMSIETVRMFERDAAGLG